MGTNKLFDYLIVIAFFGYGFYKVFFSYSINNLVFSKSRAISRKFIFNIVIIILGYFFQPSL